MPAWQIMKAYLKVSLGALVVLAALVLVLMQWGNWAHFSAYGKNTSVNTAWLMFCSAVGGVVVGYAGCMLFSGTKLLLSRRRDRLRQEAQIAQAVAAQHYQPPASGGPAQPM